MTDLELHVFYEDLVRELRSRGVLCAITSGLACVHYGIAETTQDCDLLCHPGSFPILLDLLAETKINSHPCHYRGNISPPLDARWHRGGWTSHFQWDTQPVVITLDVFGHALRESSPWQGDIAGLYAGENVVAEMKRTDRDKDWPFITSLGVAMLRARDPRGWLHLFEEDAVIEMQAEFPIPDELLKARPVLELARRHDSRLRHALLAERRFWQELDHLRIRICRAALRPYVVAVARNRISKNAALPEQHAARLACAEASLEINPIGKFGIERLIQEACQSTMVLVRPEFAQWLPDVRQHFTFLHS